MRREHLGWFLRGLIVSVACASAVFGHAAPKEHVVLQLSYTHQFEFAGVYAALKEGYFTEQGLDVEVRTSRVARGPMQEVESGRADYGIGPSGVLVDRLNGKPLVALAAFFQHSPFVLMVRADSGIATPSDLVGKRITLSPLGRYTELRAMLHLEGIRPDQFVPIQDNWAVNELTTGAADAVSTYLPDEPYRATLTGLDYKLIRPADYGVDFYGDVLFSTENEVRDHRSRALAMRQALVKGWEYALRHPDEIIDWILRELPEKERSPGRTREWLKHEAQVTASLVSADLVEIGHMNSGRWARMAELTVAIGQAPSTENLQGFVVDLSRVGEPGWVRWALGGLGIAVLVAAVAILANRRLQSLVNRRTRELGESEQRQREYFDLAPAPIVIEDYTALEPVLVNLREEGVSDLRAYLENKPKLVRELFAMKRVVAANRLALRRTGYSSLEEMDRHLAEIMTEQAMDMFVEELVTIWKGSDRMTMEKIYHTKLGETIHTLIMWEIGEKDGQRDLANVRLVFTEVTQQKQAEAALRQSEERYRQLFEQAVGGVYRSNPDGHLVSANPALARLFGFERPDELIAWARQQSSPSLYVRPGRREEFVGLIDLHGTVSDFESEVRTSDGGTRWISENARAVRDDQGQLQYYEGFVTDITARRQLEGEIARASKLEAVGILAGGIAHDFNNILTVVLGNVSLLEMDAVPGSPTAARLQDAKRATLRARDLTLQLLTFAKGGEPVKTTIELPELLKESVGFALHGAKARAEFRLVAGLWRVSADKGQIGQVVQNLVINAVQAMPNGGVVTITADNLDHVAGAEGGPALGTGRYVRLTVSDTGMGIPREHLAKIFDPYFTTKAQGSGLGLATAYSVVRKHDGIIIAESETGNGTKFTIWLPAVATESTNSLSPLVGSRSPFRARVLFMDDETAIRAMAGIFMERLGYECETAVDGAETLRKYEQAMEQGKRFEAVIMDLTVPGGMGGREAMERLLRIDPSVCAIVSSGYSRDPVLANYRAHGFQGILPKPYGLEHLAKVMTDVLENTTRP